MASRARLLAVGLLAACIAPACSRTNAPASSARTTRGGKNPAPPMCSVAATPSPQNGGRPVTAKYRVAPSP